jgi:endo-1,4-beta-mannosidase
MSLKTDFYDGSTGFNEQMNDVFDQGEAFVTTNLATLTTELQSAAAKGLKTFKVTIVTAFEPQNLRLKGFHMKSYLAGIQSAMSAEDIYPYEVALSLNTEDTMETKIDFNFTF